MANIYQVLQREEKVNKTKAFHAPHKEILEKVERLKKLDELISDSGEPFTTNRGNFIIKTNEDLLIEQYKIQANYWNVFRHIPKQLIRIKGIDNTFETVYTNFASLPIVKLEKIREIAKSLSMIILPLEYIEINEVLKTQPNSAELIKKKDSFIKMFKEYDTREYDFYVLCPVQYYSNWQHTISGIDKEIYYTDVFDQLFQSIDLMLPTGRNLYLMSQQNQENTDSLIVSMNANTDLMNQQLQKFANRITASEEKVINACKKIDQFQNEIDSMNMRINKVEDELEIKKIRQAEAIRIQQKMSTQGIDVDVVVLENMLKLGESERAILYAFNYVDYDPILFAIDKDSDLINSNVEAFIGLCWGKDIPESFLESKGFVINNKDIYNGVNLDNCYGLSEVNNLKLQFKMHNENFERFLNGKFSIFLEYSSDVEKICYLSPNINEEKVEQELGWLDCDYDEYLHIWFENKKCKYARSSRRYFKQNYNINSYSFKSLFSDKDVKMLKKISELEKIEKLNKK